MRTLAAVVASLLSAALIGCGGGGGGDPATCGTMLHPNPCAATTSASSAGETAASIQFVSADTTNIALKGTGGVGRQEFSTLTFKVFDNLGNAVAGAPVDFAFANPGTVGAPSLVPAAATTSADGAVSTIVSAGTMPTSVRVTATIDGAPSISTVSNVLVVSTGVPDQRHFSLATLTGNCEGGDIDQTCSTLTVTLGDHFGNPAPDGTAVNFTTGGGVVDASCVTGSLPPVGSTPVGQTTNSKVGPGSGTCSVVLRASNPRTLNGRVTVLAYAIGEEDFFDNNGDNVFNAGDTFVDKSPDIFRDDNENFQWNAGEPCIGPNANGLCSTPGDGKYNGVLGQAKSPYTLYVSDQLVQVFSGSHASIVFTPSALSCSIGNIANVQVTVTDENGNVMPADTTISFSVLFSGGATGTVNPASAKVPNYVLGVGEPMPISSFSVAVGCPAGAASGTLTATVVTPSGVVSSAEASIN